MDTVSRTGPKPRRTKPRGPHPHKALAAAFVSSAPPGRHADGNGLFLYVQPTGTRSWIQRLVVRGRRRELGLGSIHLVTLAEAREAARANRKLAREGGDPLAERRRARSMPTFAEAAALVVERKRPGWRDDHQPRAWLNSLERYAFPRIGGVAVSEVNSADVLEILSPIWHTKMVTAQKMRGRIGAVLEWAIAMNYRTDNPCDRIAAVLGKQQHVVEHMRALAHQDVAAAVATVRSSARLPGASLAFEFLVLTAARWGEVRDAEWAEVDLAGRVWTIPATRMKMKREHRVPLCGRALEVLAAARTLRGGGGRVVFTARSGQPLHDKSLRRLLQEHGLAAVPHGFRSSFRDWAAELTDHPREVVEAALAHVVGNKVEAAYARSDLFERRRRLMDDWGAYLAGAHARQPPVAEPAEHEAAGTGAP